MRAARRRRWRAAVGAVAALGLVRLTVQQPVGAAVPSWAIADLGGLPGAVRLEVNAAAGDGTIGGTAWYANGTSRAFVVRGSTIVDLGPFGASGSSAAIDVNATGQLIGADAAGRAARRSFSQTADGAPLETLATVGGSVAVATALNDNGQVAGYSTDAGGEVRPFVDLGAGPVALGGVGEATDINAGGMVVGYLTDPGTGLPRAFHTEPVEGLVILVPHPAGAVGSVAQHVSSTGAIAGVATMPTGQHAVLWATTSSPTDLGTLGGGWSDVTDLTDSGLVVGRSERSDGAIHAFAWTSTWGMRDLGALGERSDHSAPHDANDVGLVVGESVTDDGRTHAFAWDPTGVMVDLGTLEDGSESRAFALDAAGRIVGVADDASGSPRLVRWTPTGVPLDAPAAPADLWVWSGDGADVRLAWRDASWNEARFDIWRARWNATLATWGEWTYLPAAANTSGATDADVADGQYAYVVQAVNSAGYSQPAIAVYTQSTTQLEPEPPTVTQLRSVADTVELEWADTADNELVYEVLRARWNPADLTWGEWVSWALDANSTSFVDTSAGDAVYAYLVRANNAVAPSDWQIRVHAHTWPAEAPAAPTDLAVTRSSEGAALTWVDGSDNEFGFDVQRARFNGTEWTDWTSWSTDRNSTEYFDAFTTGDPVAYLVRSYNAVGESEWMVVVS